MLRPKTCIDIRQSRRISSYRRLAPVIYLGRSPRRRLSFRPFVTGILAVFVCGVLLFGSAAAPSITNQTFAAPTNGQDAVREREALTAELRRLEAEMAAQEATITQLKGQGKTLQSEINRLTAESNKLALKIKAVEISLAKLNDEIAENTERIHVTEDKLSLNRSALVKTLQTVYEQDRSTLLEIVLQSNTLSDFFGLVSSFMEVQDGLTARINVVNALKQDLLDEQEALALKKYDTEVLKRVQAKQRVGVEQLKGEKAKLLSTTKGQESRYQQLLQETRKTAAQIRNRIFELLGGGELTFAEAYQFAQFAGQGTGIRPALILAVLDRESALGQNVGKCSYTTAMHPTRDIPVFLAITAALGLDPNTVQVSCANRDGLYGGAMGPAQFIPSTWKLYEEKIAEISGNRPPSPWRNGDAFLGTALYLKDAYNSSACRSYAAQIPSERQTLQERCAAARYYAGGRWYTYRWVYGEPVVDRANGFERDIEILAKG